MSSSSGNVTGILRDLREGDRRAADKLLPIVYQELRALASRHLPHQRPGHTLKPTALVHEAYLRLVNQDWAVPAARDAVTLATLDRSVSLFDQKRGVGEGGTRLNSVTSVAPSQVACWMAGLSASR